MINAQSVAPFNPSDNTPFVPHNDPAVTTTTTSSSVPPAGKKAPNKWMKYVLAGILLLIVVVGGGVGYYLNQQSQDLRQQASENEPPARNAAVSNMTATLGENTATFRFKYTGDNTNGFRVELSTTPDFSSDVNVTFGTVPYNANSADYTVTVDNPKDKWDKYVCAARLYWRVSYQFGDLPGTSTRYNSAIQPATVTCASTMTQCVKTAYVDQGAGNFSNLVETKVYNSTQPLLFKVEVTAGSNGTFTITDYIKPFVDNGYTLDSVTAVPAGACQPIGADKPEEYSCEWAATQGQKLQLYIRMTTNTAFLVEPEKITVRNLATIISGGAGLLEGDTAGRTDGEENGENRPNQSCEVQIQIPGTTGVIPTPTSEYELSCTNTPYANETTNTAGTYSISLGNQKNTFKPGEMVVFQVNVRTNGVNPVVVTLPFTDTASKSYLTYVDSTCGTSAYNSGANTVTCPALDFSGPVLSNSSGVEKTLFHTIRMKIASNAPTVKIPVTASVQATINDTARNPKTCATTISVDASSDSDDDDDDDTPAVGCNQTCNTNSDCSNPDHICSDQNGSKVCRLSSNVGSSSCSSPSSSTSTPQPTLPSELPQTGATDVSTWLKAGLGALGAGILILLLL